MMQIEEIILNWMPGVENVPLSVMAHPFSVYVRNGVLTVGVFEDSSAMERYCGMDFIKLKSGDTVSATIFKKTFLGTVQHPSGEILHIWTD